MRELRQVMTGAGIREAAGIADEGAVRVASVKNVDGGPVVEIADDGSDIYTWAKDEAGTGLPLVARLFSPGNMVWALPDEDDSCMVLEGAEAHGPGTGYLLHGDGGKANAVPDWLSNELSGISPPAGRSLRIESRDGYVVVTSAESGSELKVAADGKITATAGGSSISITKDGDIEVTAAAGKGVNVDAGAAGIVKVNGGGQPVARGTIDRAGWFPIISTNTRFQSGT